MRILSTEDSMRLSFQATQKMRQKIPSHVSNESRNEIHVLVLCPVLSHLVKIETSGKN